MSSRPRSITIISWLFIAAGSVGLLYHLSEFSSRSPIDYGVVAISVIRLVAILAGIFMLRGSNWARWLLVAWMAYHIVLSAIHSAQEFVMHALLFGIVACFLFGPRSFAYLRGISTVSPESPPKNEKPVA